MKVTIKLHIIDKSEAKINPVLMSFKILQLLTNAISVIKKLIVNPIPARTLTIYISGKDNKLFLRTKSFINPTIPICLPKNKPHTMPKIWGENNE